MNWINIIPEYIIYLTKIIKTNGHTITQEKFKNLNIEALCRIR